MSTIVVDKRPDDYIAYLDGRKEVWGCGASAYEAIGNLVNGHAHIFGVTMDRRYMTEQQKRT